MLTIEIFGYGNEFYKHEISKSDFNEKNFLDKYSESYHEIEDENFDMLIADEDRVSIIANLNGKEVFNEQGSLGLELKATLDKENNTTWKEFAESNDDNVTVIWGHGGIISFFYTFNEVDSFSIEKLKIFRLSLPNSEDDDSKNVYISGVEYDGKDPDEEEPDFNPKYGYWGPKIY